MSNILQTLKAEHDQVRALFEQLDATTAHMIDVLQT